MLTRRSLIGSAAATPLIWNTAFAETPKDVAVMAMQIDDIISFDPGEAFEFSDNEIGSNCYEKLVEPDAADPTRINGVLASHWEVAGDGITYTFYLRQDHKFASGNLVTADDVAWSLQRAVTMDKAPGFILTQFGLNKDNAEARIKALDAHTVVMQIAEGGGAQLPPVLPVRQCRQRGREEAGAEPRAGRRSRQRLAEERIRRVQRLGDPVVEGERQRGAGRRRQTPPAPAPS